MDLKKTGGPAYPTLSGGPVDDKTFRWEGMTLFDWYAGQFIATGEDCDDALDLAAEIIEKRLDYLKEES